MHGTSDIRRQSFDEIAKLYDEVRPHYPKALVKDILRIAALPGLGRVLEVGSGTGKATRLFADKCHEIVCIEPGKNLTDVARSNLGNFANILYENCCFEDWNVEKESFDLLISAQAFHWISPAAGFRNAAEALKPSGTIALFWNLSPSYSSKLDEAIADIYRTYIPFTSRSVVENPVAIVIDDHLREVEQTGAFGPVTVKKYSWAVDYTSESYTNLLQSYTDLHLISAGVRRAFLKEIKAAIEEFGGVYTKPYTAVLYTAQKLS